MKGGVQMLKIKEIRIQKKLTQEEVSNATGISYSMLTKLENGHRGSSDETKRKLADFYGKSIPYLFFSDSITKSEKQEVI